MRAQRRKHVGRIIAGLAVGLVWCLTCWTAPTRVARGQGDGAAEDMADERLAVRIPCTGMIDEGLFESIRRRTEEAISLGADYLIFDIDTYGGLVVAADQISDFFILDLNKRVHTVAYVSKRAISAGALISVACEDIIMLEHTTIGDCAPIMIGTSVEGVEREKMESPIRAAFSRSAEANGYPDALLQAMVSQHLEVWQVRNNRTGQWEFFETDDLPTDEEAYDVQGKQRVVKEGELLTLTASQAKDYGIARAVVKDYDEVLAFLAERDGVRFSPERITLRTSWSEDMVRWLNSPAVLSVLVLVAMLGLYMEFNTPGVGLPGAVALAAIAVIVGSKYLVDLANWIEVAIFVLGIVLLMVELLLLPGFGVAGVTGILCILVGLFGMLVRNAPGELPWPKDAIAWNELASQLTGVAVGLLVFVVIAVLFARYMPHVPLFRGLILPPVAKPGPAPAAVTASPEEPAAPVTTGERGRAVSPLRPVGQARFGTRVVDVVAQGEFVAVGAPVRIVEVHGNRVVVIYDPGQEDTA